MAGASEEIPLVDFASKMVEYGLPDLSAATYVRIEDCWEAYRDELLSYAWPVKGSAWMISEVRDDAGNPERGVFVVNGNEVIELAWKKTEKEWRALDVKSLLAIPSFGSHLVGRWRKVSLKLDARQTLRYVKSLDQSGGMPYEIQDERGGGLALFAVGLWQQGEREAAEEIWSYLTLVPGSGVHLLQEAMLLVVNGEYENVYQRFRVEHDWEAYADGIQRVLDKKPEGWGKVDALKELHRRIKARLEKTASWPAATNGWTEADFDLAARMLNVKAPHLQRRQSDEPFYSWMIPTSWLDQAPRPLDVELEVRSRGVWAIPFLLALSQDVALTDAEGNPGRDKEIYGWSRNETFGEMNRPATRGELAFSWLSDLLPESISGERYSRKSKGEVRVAAQAFFEQHKNDSDAEMALQEISRPRGDFNQKAVDYLLERAGKAPVPELETYLLEAALPDTTAGDGWDEDFTRGWRYDMRLELAAKYAVLRGNSARDFTEAFIRLLRSEAARGQLPKKVHAVQDAENLERLLFQTTLDDAWAVLRKTGQIPPEGVERTIWETRMDCLPRAEAIRMLLAQAAEHSGAEVRGLLAAQLQRLGAMQKPEGLGPADAAAAWEILIADDRPEQVRSFTPVSDRYLALNEQFFAEPFLSAEAGSGDWPLRWMEAGRQAGDILSAPGSRGREWLRGRVRQRLAGQPEAELPPYPDGAPPSEESLASVREKFMGIMDRAGAAKTVELLSLPEYAALPVMLRREPELNGRLGRLSGWIERVTIEGKAGEKFRSWEGQMPTKGLVEEMRRFCEEQAKEQQLADCRLIRKGDFGGCELHVETQPLPEEGRILNGHEVHVVGVAGLACGPGIYGAVYWRTKPFGKKRMWWATIPSDENDWTGYREAVDALLDPSTPASNEGFVVFQNQGEGE